MDNRITGVSSISSASMDGTQLNPPTPSLWCSDHPVLPSSANPDVFRVTLSNGTIARAFCTSFSPNVEYNERQIVVIFGYWGNRLAPGTPGAVYPVKVEIVDNATNPFILLGPQGFVYAGWPQRRQRASGSAYGPGEGPRNVAAKLNVYTEFGEGCPLWLTESFRNSGSDLYGSDARYRIRLYTSSGFSPDGIRSIMPDEYKKFFYITAIDKLGNMVNLTDTGVAYKIKGYGAITVIGLADCGSKQATYNAAYIEDHDNQYDIILKRKP